MSRKPNNIRANAMKVAYDAGMSLAEVGEAFDCTRQSVFVMFKRRGWEMRAKPAPLPAVEWGGGRYTMRNTGYLGRTDRKRTLLHRDVWESVNGKIPDGLEIHHVDHDRLNNDISNLTMMSKADHARLHGLTG